MTTKVITETLHIPTLEAAAALQCSYCKRPEKYGVAELDAESDLYAHRKNGSRWYDAGRIWREIENQQQVSQPVLDSGQEWSQHPYKSSLIVANFDEGSGEYEIVANTKDAKLPVHTATQIVSDHNATRDADELQDFYARRLSRLTEQYGRMIDERNEALLLLVETRRVLLALEQSESVTIQAERIRQYLAASPWAEAKAAAREGV